MKGVIRHINLSRGMVAVLTEDGSYSVFELLGGESVEIEDIVSWMNDTGLGGEQITNHTQNERFEVFFQNHCVPPYQLRQQLLYP